MTSLRTFADLEASLRERTNFELRRPPPGGWGLERMQRLLDALDSPQLAYPVVHVAGTTGKGTTCSAIASVLDAAGLRVGLTTSPHLIDLRERIRIGARPASDDLWLRAAEHVLAASDDSDPPTYFEIVIATAFVAFREAHVNVAVVEVGLGGRLDATNLVRPAVSVITRIGLDHTEMLGADLRSIAKEKAGIVKARIPVVIAPGSSEAEAAIAERAAAVGAPIKRLATTLDDHGDPAASDGRVEVLARTSARTRVRLSTRRWSGELDVPLTPAVATNVGLAALAVEVLGESLDLELTSALRQGLDRVAWRGRFDVIPAADGSPLTVIDGAHDLDSIDALVDGLGQLHTHDSEPDESAPSARPVLLLAMLEGKPLDGVCARLATACQEAICCAAPSPRARSAAELAASLTAAGVRARAVEGGVVQAFAAARARAIELAAPLVVTGSLYLAGAVLAELGEDAGAAWRV